MPGNELVDYTARVRIDGLQNTIGDVRRTVEAVQGDIRHIRDDVHEAKLGFATEIHAATLKMAPLAVWVKILSGAAIALSFGVFSLVGTLIWKTVTNHIEDRPPVSQWQERLAPDRASEPVRPARAAAEPP